MKRFSVNGPPSPEEFQKQMTEFMRQHFSPFMKESGSKAESGIGGEETPAPKKGVDPFYFDKKPKEIKAYLDRFVIKQEEAKKVLSVAMCDHYHHVRLALEGRDQPNYTKQNIILLGPTGVGKTYLIRSVAELIGVPFIKGDATKFSETGYVGGDVEDLVRELVRAAEGDVKRAEYGIIYIDEIDKIAGFNGSQGRDVSGRGVQTNLLKLMEETEVPARSAQDIAGQVQALMEMQTRGKKTPASINTKHILFIVSGAFSGIEKIILRRMREATIGFGARHQEIVEEESMAHVNTRDFIDFGFEPEFVGRLPIRVVCQSLNSEDLYDILKSSEGSIIRQYEQTFAAYGIEVKFADEGLRRIAELAVEEGTGARGLMTICERIFRDFKYELPSTTVKAFTVDGALVDEPGACLKGLLQQHSRETRREGFQFVTEFARKFFETHSLKIDFSEDAADTLVQIAEEQGKRVEEVCEQKFKDFHFGLKLIAQNTGKAQFLIEKETVNHPDKTLSEWVVLSYRGQEDDNGPRVEPSGDV